MIGSYFSRTGLKRNHSSTSDESDVSISSVNDSKKQEKKRMNTVVEDSDMAVQTAIDNISKRFDTLATKVDVEQMRDEVKCLTKTFMEKLENQDRRIKQNERELNDLQQYSRRWNLRVFKVPVKEKETAADCTAKVCAIFIDKVGTPITASDIEVASGQDNAAAPEQGPFLCDSSIVRRETASSPADATSRTKVMSLGKT